MFPAIHAPARHAAARHAALFQALVLRDLKGQFRRSWLGPAWAVLQPAMLLAMFLLLRGIVPLPSEGAPYPVFALSALVPWTFFVNAVTRAGPSVVNNAGVVKKIGLPREIFPMVAVSVSLVDFTIASALLAGLAWWYGLPVGAHLLWLVPLLALLMALAFALGLLIASVGTFQRDVLFAIPFLFQFGLLATPVMYPASAVPPQWRVFYDLNPLVGPIEGFRRVIVHGAAPDLGALAVSAAVAAVLLAVALPVFRAASRYFADIL